MATGTFTYNSLHAKTLQNAYQNANKRPKTFKVSKNVVSTGQNLVKIIAFYIPYGI